MANITRRSVPERTIAPRREFAPFRLMEDLLRWDPFRVMTPFREGVELAGYTPNFEVKETKDAYLFKADLPGVKDSDLDISLSGNVLTISGKREAEEKEEGETYFAYERSYGSFSRCFTLPDGVDTDHARADLKEGVLTVAVPKRPEVQPKKIELKATPSGKEKAKA